MRKFMIEGKAYHASTPHAAAYAMLKSMPGKYTLCLGRECAPERFNGELYSVVRFEAYPSSDEDQALIIWAKEPIGAY